jgi:hypothetical protein
MPASLSAAAPQTAPIAAIVRAMTAIVIAPIPAAR